MCQLIGSQTKKMSEIVDSLGINPSQKLYVHAPDDKVKLRAVEELKNKFIKEFKGKKIITVDGIKVYLNEEEWFLIRPSNTATEINLCVEAKNEKRLNELLKKYTEIIEQEVKNQK
jgi:phosphomannomutase